MAFFTCFVPVAVLDTQGSFEQVPAKLLNLLDLSESEIQNTQHITRSSSALCTGQKLHGAANNAELKKERSQSLKYYIYSLFFISGIRCPYWDGKCKDFQEIFGNKS